MCKHTLATAIVPHFKKLTGDLQRDAWSHYGSSTGVFERKCCESVSFRDIIYIFYEKKKKFINGIQAFELLFFTRTMNAHLPNA